MHRMSHSFHLSSGKHSISTSTKLSSVDKHNNRKFTNANNDNLNLNISELNTTLIGSDNISNDVRELYTELFDSSVKEFNERQNRKKNIITSYFNKISNDTKQNIAEEVIIQFGSTNEDDIHLKINSVEDVEKIKGAYSDYLSELQKQVPNFKIANATIHFDEVNPHMHIIGIPISENNKKGLSTKVSKRSVFNRETLSKLQTTMGQAMVTAVNDNLNLKVSHTKEAGRKKQLSTPEIVELKEIKNKIKEDIANYKKLSEEILSDLTQLDKKYIQRQEELEKIDKAKNELVSDVNVLTEEKKLLVDTLRKLNTIIDVSSDKRVEIFEEIDQLKSENKLYEEDNAKLKENNEKLIDIYNKNHNATLKQARGIVKQLESEELQKRRQRGGGLSL